MTHEALIKAKIDLYNIVANHAYQDWHNTNYNTNGKRKSKKHIPYSLSHDTLRAQEIYDLVYGKSAEEITIDVEELVKGFLINYRLNRTEYLKDLGGNKYYSN